MRDHASNPRLRSAPSDALVSPVTGAGGARLRRPRALGFGLAVSLAALLGVVSGCGTHERLEDFMAEQGHEAVRAQLEDRHRSAVEDLKEVGFGRDQRAVTVLAAAQKAFMRLPREEESSEEKIRPAHRASPTALPFLPASSIERLASDARGRLAAEVKPARVGRPTSNTFAPRGARLEVGNLTAGALKISAELRGARNDVEPSLVDGYLVYPAVFEGSGNVNLLRRVAHEGTEDYLVYAERPTTEQFVYHVELDPGVAGLRQVEGTNVLEFLSKDGTPRLRINPPVGMDADADLFPVVLAVSGCKVDTSPALPYGRPTTDPGARACDVHFAWHAKSYPAAVDPTFFSTGSMSKGRYAASATQIGTTGRVIVWNSDYMGGDAAAEVYDFATGTWTTTASVPFAPMAGAGWHNPLRLPNGRPLAIQQNGTSTASYDGATGTWKTEASLPKTSRENFAGDSAVMLQNGDILVGGGSHFKASTQTWELSPDTPSQGAGFFAPFGGHKAMWSDSSQAWAYDSTTNAFTALPSVPFSNMGYGAGAMLVDGRVIVPSQYGAPKKCAIYAPTSNSWSTCADMNTYQIIEPAIAALPTGVLYIGIDYAGTQVGKAENYDPATNKWTVNALPYAAADFPTLAVMTDGRVLLAGGMTFQDSSVGFTSSAVFGCKVDADCGSSQLCDTSVSTLGSCTPTCHVATEATDCGANGYCDDGGSGSNGNCRAKVANGGAIPAYVPFSSVCTATSGTRTCISSACSATDNLCGLLNGASATAVAQCRSNVLYSDGKCGYPDGVSATDPATCRSGSIVAGKCGSSTLPNGSGPCTPGADAKCASGICGSDGLCGLPSGEGACTTANQGTVCRSGSCGASSGKCVPSGGCMADADCSVLTKWCSISTMTCMSKVANGGSVPADAAHVTPVLDGTCTTAAASLTCVSAVCSTDDARCGLPNGVASGSTAECRSGARGADGICGLPNGATPGAGGAGECRSGLVGANGLCGLANAEGPCTVATEAAICQSAVCGADGKCGYANGAGPCDATSAATVCRSLVCDPDGKCGLADGHGTCSASNAGVVCRSSTCGASSAACVPAISGCASDADCAGSQWCNLSALTCAAKVANGGALPTDASHVTPVLDGTCSAAAGALTCVSGACDADGKCGVKNGDAATLADQCRSGVLHTDGLCGVPNGVAPGTAGVAACRSGVLGANGRCGYANGEGTCDATSAASVCQSSRCGADAKCGYANGEGTCDATSAAAVCRSSACDPDGKCGLANGSAGCTTATQGSVCRSSTCGASSGKCVPATGGCAADGDCATATEWCDVSKLTCAAKLANGKAMPTDAAHGTPVLDGKCTTSAASLVCVATVCDVDDECGRANGSTASGASQCRTGVLSADGKCGVPNGQKPGAGGAVECRAAVVGADGLCGFANGQGSCTAATGALVCRAGVCDPDGKCGLSNGKGTCTAATAATVCRSAACGLDGLCGLPNGAGTCTTATQGTLCRSGFCSPNASVCVPATSGCAVDLDCSAGSWCNESALTCTAKLTNPQPMPTDGKHSEATVDGKCNAAAAKIVCASGVCDARDDRCGYYDQGSSVCTASDATKVCRSGFCSTTGTCIQAATCLADADCPGAWCNLAKGKCAPLVPNGDAMPTDASHVTPVVDGTCTVAASKLVCASAVCDATDQKCGLPNGASCAGLGDAPCRTGGCAADGLCGKVVGATCALAADCRSGNCVAGFCDADTDGDGVSDVTEQRLGTDPKKADSDDDGVRDNVELTADHSGTGDFTGVDTDGDGVIDALDADDDGDSVPTKDELGGGATPRDTDGDGKADYLDADDDGDSVPTKDELGAGGAASPRDTDGDGKVDYLDADDDGDGVATKDELGAGGAASPRDTDADGKADFLDDDDDGDGLLTKDELGAGGAASPVDTDKDGKADFLDDDDDGDGIPTKTEIADGKLAKVSSDDVDKDGQKNWLDTDADGDGILDGAEKTDADGDGVPDYLQAKTVTPTPTDAGGVEGEGATIGGGGVSCSTGTGGASSGGLTLVALGVLGLVRKLRRRRDA
jgi:hypothetical protein